MLKYYFVSVDGEVFINLPKMVSYSTIRSIMSDCGYKKVYVLRDGIKLFLDLS